MRVICIIITACRRFPTQNDPDHHPPLGLDTQMEQPGLHGLHAAALPDRPAADLPPRDRRPARQRRAGAADGAGRAMYPNKMAMYVSQYVGEPDIWNLTLGDNPTDASYKSIAIDARTAQVLAQPSLEGGLMGVMYHLDRK